MMFDRKTSKDNITGILLLTHGNLGEGLIHTASMIYGKLEEVKVLCLQEGENLEAFAQKIQYICSSFSGEVLVLVDLFGGTPGNILMKLLHDGLLSEKKIIVISGVNLPMLLEALNLRGDLSGEALTSAVIEASKEGIVNVGKFVYEI